MIIKRRTNEEWLELYRQQRSSGLTMKEWCAEKDIKLSTMADRITRLRKLDLIAEEKPGRGKNSYKKDFLNKHPERSWVEVTTKSADKETTSKTDAIAPITVLAGKYTVHVHRGFEPEVLKEVCRVLVGL